MANDVGTILGSAQRARLLALQTTARQLDGVSSRLASGKRVSSALDGPSNYFAARSLQDRSAALSRLLDGIGQNIRTIEEADHGIEAQLDILDLAESFLEETERKYRADEVTAATFAPTNETRVTFTANTDLVTYVPAQDTAGYAGITVPDENEVSFSGNYWRRKAFDYTVTSDTVLVFEYRSASIPEVVTIGFDNDTDFGNDNRRFWLYGTQVFGATYAAPTADYDYSGSGDWETIEIPVGDFFTGSFSWINFIHDDDAAPFGSSSFRNIVLREGAVQEAPLVANSAAYFRKEYARILEQFDSIAEDAHYRGVNLLNGDDMTTYFNRDRSNTLVTEGITSTIEGLGLDLEGLDTIADVREKIFQVRHARERLRVYSASIATDLNIIQSREDFTQGQINVSEGGAHDLTDADLNEEGAKFLALQTLQQIEVNMIALGQSSVLSLFA